MNKPASLSVVVPCYNEEEVLPTTFNRLNELCLSWKTKNLITDFELVFVDDGSKDKTHEVLAECFNKSPQVVLVEFRRNFGFQAALLAGLFAAKNDMIVSIDSDLQDDPTKIEEMITKYYEGNEMVLGIRKDRTTDSFFKRFTAHLFYRFIKYVGAPSVYNHADFRLLSKEIVQELQRFPERVRYLRSLIFSIESKYATVYYDRTARTLGKSKFNFSKMYSLALDGITSFSTAPIRFISLLGVALFFLSLIGLAYTGYVRFFLRGVVPGWASELAVLLFFSGIQNLALGIIGEYLSKTYLETKQRPPYIVRKEYRH